MLSLCLRYLIEQSFLLIYLIQSHSLQTLVWPSLIVYKQHIILSLSFCDPLHCYTRKRTVSNLLLEFTHHVTQGEDRAQNHLCQVRHIEYHCFLTCFLLQALKITMKKPPDSFKLGEPLKTRNDAVRDEPVVLYDGMQCWLWTKALIL